MDLDLGGILDTVKDILPMISYVIDLFDHFITLVASFVGIDVNAPDTPAEDPAG